MKANTTPFTGTLWPSPRINLFSGWAISETGEVDSITVTFLDGENGDKLFPSILVPPGISVGEDLGHPIESRFGVAIEVTGGGVCDGVVRGHV